jgi:hypothetical protein
MEGMKERATDFGRRLLAIAVLLVAAYLLFKVVIGVVAAVAWVVVAVIAVVAVIWAIGVLR